MASRVAASSPPPVVVGWGRQGGQRDAARLNGDRTLEPLFAAVDRAGPGDLAAAGCLGGAAVDRQVLQLQAEQLVIGTQHQQAQLLGKAQGDPLVAAATQGRGRAGVIGDPAVAAAEHQHLDELVEHDPVRNPGPVAAERVLDLTGREQGGDLDPQGFHDGRWQGRHETSAWSQGVRTP
jgi:hypothetical protein